MKLVRVADNLFNPCRGMKLPKIPLNRPFDVQWIERRWLPDAMGHQHQLIRELVPGHRHHSRCIVLDTGIDANEQGLFSGDELRASTLLDATIPELSSDENLFTACPVILM